jgi:hypothetical protein
MANIWNKFWTCWEASGSPDLADILNMLGSQWITCCGWYLEHVRNPVDHLLWLIVTILILVYGTNFEHVGNPADYPFITDIWNKFGLPTDIFKNPAAQSTSHLYSVMDSNHVSIILAYQHSEGRTRIKWSAWQNHRIFGKTWLVFPLEE